MKKFKKHKFISMETLARLFGVDVLNMKFFKDYYDKKYSYYVEPEKLHRVGYGQYAITDRGDIKFDIIAKKREENGKLSELYYHWNLDLPCGELFTLDQMKGYRGYTKVKPIYKITDKITKEPVNYETGEFKAGRYNVELVGILIK